MLRLLGTLVSGLLVCLGMMGVNGCSSSTGNQGGIYEYRIVMYAQPPSVQTGGASKDSIFCFLTFGDGINDTIATNNIILFRASSGSQSSITPQATSANNDMGTIPTVYHFPNNVAAGTDTIFAVFINAVQETLAWNSTVVQILP